MKIRSKIFELAVFQLFMCLLIFLAFPEDIKSQAEKISKPESVSIQKPSTLYMLMYDHGGLVLWGTDHFTKYLRNAISWLDRYPGFKIGLDNEAYTYDFLNQHDTVLLNELRSYLKRYRGRFGIGTCTYGQPLSQFINEESNVRQIGYAIETEQSLFQYTPKVYLMSEHAMHSQLPQILSGFGFKGVIMRTHFMMFGYNPTYNSPIGWWIGRDGSPIAAIPTYNGEGSGFGWNTEDNLILNRYPGPEFNESLEDFREKYSDINPLLASRVDDSGTRQEELVKEYEGKSGYKWLLADDIFPSFPSPVDEFKPLPDDFHVRMPWGYCGNEIWNMSRLAEVRVLTAERLAALQSMMGGDNHEIELQKSWKNLLVAQHHDIQICGLLDDSRKFLPASIGISDSIIRSSMNYFSSRMAGGSLAQVTIFNPLSWTRKEWINVKVTLPGDPKSINVQKGGKSVPFEILSSQYMTGKRLTTMNLLVQVEIPGLTFQSFAITSSKQKQEVPKTIEFDKQKLEITTPFWIINLNKRGGIEEITSRLTGRQLLRNQKSSYISFSIPYIPKPNVERSGYFAGVINGQPVESIGKWNLDSAFINDNQLTMHEDGTIGNIPYRLEMILSSASPRIDFRAKFNFNNERIGRLSDNKHEITSAFLHEEKLRFKLFPALRIGRTGIRDLPFTIAETENKYIEGNYWTAMSDGHSGMAIFNKGNMGSVHEDDESFSLPLAYSMYYVFKTVILKGNFTYEFAIYPFEGNWVKAGLHHKALEYNFQCVTASSIKGNAKSGDQIQPFNIAAPDIILSALYTKNGKPFIRFYESNGTKSELKLDYLSGTAHFTEVDLSGKEEGKMVSSLLFHPWQIKTFRVDKTGP